MADDRPWMDDYAYESNATRNTDGSWHLAHIRDFLYEGRTITKAQWTNIDVYPSAVESVSFFVASLPLGVFRNLSGHTYISFHFKDDRDYVFSIEGRRRKGQPFSTINGMLGAYQLIYLWGTLSDFTERNTTYEDVHLERYDLLLSKNELKQLCEAALEETKHAYNKKLPYHTIWSQCTNKLLEVFNKALIKKLPWSLAWHFPGLSPRLLAKHGLVDLSKKETLR